MTDTYEPTMGALPPHNIEAEQATLGAMMLSPSVTARIMEIVKTDHFFRPAHQVIFDAITGLHTAGKPHDALAVEAELSKQGESTRTGGAPYLHTLTDVVPTVGHGTHYANIVSEVFVDRCLTEIGISMEQLGRRGHGEASDKIERARAMIEGIDSGPLEQGAVAKLSTVFREIVDELERPADDTGLVPMPYADLAHVLPGLKPGQMMIVGARPGAGKSIVAADIARHASMKHQVGTVMFSLEMTRREMGMRVAAAEGSIDIGHMTKKGEMTEQDWVRLAGVKDRFDAAPFWMADDFSIGLSHIRAHLSRIARANPIGLVIVDYLQLMSPGGRAENRQIEVSAMSRGLKKLAGEFGVAMVVLSQLNRESTKRADKRPQLSDLRESGSLEQDSDVVMMLHREDLIEEDSERSGEVDLILEKNRGGKGKVTIPCAFQGHYSRIVDMAGMGLRDR